MAYADRDLRPAVVARAKGRQADGSGTASRPTNPGLLRAALTAYVAERHIESTVATLRALGETEDNIAQVKAHMLTLWFPQTPKTDEKELSHGA